MVTQKSTALQCNPVWLESMVRDGTASKEMLAEFMSGVNDIADYIGRIRAGIFRYSLALITYVTEVHDTRIEPTYAVPTKDIHPTWNISFKEINSMPRMYREATDAELVFTKLKELHERVFKDVEFSVMYQLVQQTDKDNTHSIGYRAFGKSIPNFPLFASNV